MTKKGDDVSQPMGPQATSLSASTALPPAVSQLALTHRLGTHLTTFAPHKRWRIVITLGVLSLVGVLAGAALALGTTSDPLYVLVLGIAVVIVIVPSGFFIWSLTTSPVFSAKVREWHIYVFEHGYVRVAKKGAEAYRWDAVQSVYQEIVTVRYNGISTGTQYRYRITFADGRTQKLHTYLTDMQTFGPLVQSEIAKVQVPQAWQMINAGQSVGFVEFALSSAGLTAQGKGVVPWAEIREIQVIQGYVRIMRQGKRLPFAHVPAKKIPNLYTFLTITNELVRMH